MASPPAPLPADARDTTVPSTPPLVSALLVIGGLILFAIVAIVFFRRLLRRWSSSEAEGGSGVEVGTEQVDAGAAETEQEDAEAWQAMIDAVMIEAEAEPEPEPEPDAGAGDVLERLLASLPMFTLASALAALPKNSPDCAVCLSPFETGEGLRLLPTCLHAFHAACIDVWLRTNPVCPICRSAVSSPLPPLPAAAGRERRASRSRTRRSRRPRVELGSVSHRRSFAAAVDDRRAYSLGGSFGYRVEEEVEGVVSRVVRPAPAPAPMQRPATAAPGEEALALALAEAVVSRGWLGEYLDRAAASASSLSGRLSQGRHSRRHDASTLWDPEAVAAVAKSATPAAVALTIPSGTLPAGPRGMPLGDDVDRFAGSASSLSGRWIQSHRRDESPQWDTEAAALVALGRRIFRS